MKLRYWWDVAPHVWKTILFGWMIVLLSWSLNWQIQASGSVLICAGIVADVLFSQWFIYEFLERSIKTDAEIVLPRYFRRRFREMAKQDEQPWQTARRIHNRIKQVIAINIILGTVISSYGDLIYKSILA
ncbi:hypothetical protein [Sulfurimonas sp.]|uniref:hypothetical protein n=1 Tax=Sulfurimonas sp. TaxID=2022749 RepID=UPI0026013B1D|nr:hypothetical protein [Sulfurimonas sp.]